jgi:single-strand DNA-binding protein
MNEAQVTVVGRIATAVDFRRAASGVPVARFRLASAVRRFDRRTGGWADAFTSFYTVLAWRALASNVASSVTVGEPVVVTGQLRIKENERGGHRYVSAEVLASSIGHDLSRGTSAFVRAPVSARADPVDVSGSNWDALPGSSKVLHKASAEAGIPGQAPAS